MSLADGALRVASDPQVLGAKSRPARDEATCKVCGVRFSHPAPGTGGEWTCSDACRMGRPTTQRLFVPGHFPSLNEVIEAAKGAGGRGFRYATLKRQWGELVWALAKAAKLRPVTRARFHFLWIEKDKRRDKDNVAAFKKALFDGLVKAGVIPNDGWDNVVGWTDAFEVDPSRHGVEIRIEEV